MLMIKWQKVQDDLSMACFIPFSAAILNWHIIGLELRQIIRKSILMFPMETVEYFMQIRAIPWLLMPWFLALPEHPQPFC